MRSLLFVPGHIDKYMKSALHCGADVIIPDLEDSVPGEENKKKALKNILNYACNGRFEGLQVFPRINNIKDLQELLLPGISGFMLPKIHSEVEISYADDVISKAERNMKLAYGTFKLIPLIETTLAVMNIMEICQASGRIVAVAFGSEDFLNDLGGRMGEDGRSIFTARSTIAMSAKSNKIQAIDTVHTDVFDFKGLERHCNIGRDLGFDGMLALNPKELSVIHMNYSPTDEELVKAHEIIRLSVEAAATGRGVAIIEGKFIGPPMVEAALKIIGKNELLKARNEKAYHTWR